MIARNHPTARPWRTDHRFVFPFAAPSFQYNKSHHHTSRHHARNTYSRNLLRLRSRSITLKAFADSLKLFCLPMLMSSPRFFRRGCQTRRLYCTQDGLLEAPSSKRYLRVAKSRALYYSTPAAALGPRIYLYSGDPELPRYSILELWSAPGNGLAAANSSSCRFCSALFGLSAQAHYPLTRLPRRLPR